VANLTSCMAHSDRYTLRQSHTQFTHKHASVQLSLLIRTLMFTSFSQMSPVQQMYTPLSLFPSCRLLALQNQFSLRLIQEKMSETRRRQAPIAVHTSASSPFLTALSCSLFLACGVLLLAIQDGLPRRSELTLYQPPSLRFPGWVMRSQPKKKEEATEMQVGELSTEENVVSVDYVEYVRADV